MRNWLLHGCAAWLAVAAVGCDRGQPPPTAASVRDTADQVLWEMTMDLSIDGIRRIRVRADTVYNYQASQLAELVGLHVEFFRPNGELQSTVTAEEGTYEYRTEDMEARGNVVAVTPDGRRLTTEVLRFSRASGEITGPEPFVYDGPAGQHLEGDAFRADPEFSDVRAERPGEGRAGPVGR
jgi:LPS export ABC transporter protein LptC